MCHNNIIKIFSLQNIDHSQKSRPTVALARNASRAYLMFERYFPHEDRMHVLGKFCWQHLLNRDDNFVRVHSQNINIVAQSVAGHAFSKWRKITDKCN